MQQTIHLEVNTDLDSLMQVLDWFEQLHSPMIPNSEWVKLKTALAEGFTNAVRHAHRDRGIDTPIVLEATLAETFLEFRIWDHGPGFDLESSISSFRHQLNSEATGGRGLIIMYKVASHLSYERTNDQRNCLHLIRYYEPVKTGP